MHTCIYLYLSIYIFTHTHPSLSLKSHLDVDEGERVRLVEEEQDAGLVGGHHQVVLLDLARRAELAKHGRRAERVDPAQSVGQGKGFV